MGRGCWVYGERRLGHFLGTHDRCSSKVEKGRRASARTHISTVVEVVVVVVVGGGGGEDGKLVVAVKMVSWWWWVSKFNLHQVDGK